MQFMNVSGRATAQAATFYKVEPGRVLVLHDEIDMDFGRLQVKVGGGHGGHNGLRSITQDLGSPDFIRVRCGVGRPPVTHKEAVAGYVLANFAKAEQEELRLLIGDAADAAEMVVKQGVAPAMNKFNQKKKQA
jgi:PTH1 family peptidyl-tRNA hydrolase